jgi:hypothetical protein
MRLSSSRTCVSQSVAGWVSCFSQVSPSMQSPPYKFKFLDVGIFPGWWASPSDIRAPPACAVVIHSLIFFRAPRDRRGIGCATVPVCHMVGVLRQTDRGEVLLPLVTRSHDSLLFELSACFHSPFGWMPFSLHRSAPIKTSHQATTVWSSSLTYWCCVAVFSFSATKAQAPPSCCHSESRGVTLVAVQGMGMSHRHTTDTASTIATHCSHALSQMPISRCAASSPTLVN